LLDAAASVAERLEPEQEAVALDLHDLAPGPGHDAARARDRLVEHHQEVQDAVARGAGGEVRRVGEDDRALREELGEAGAVEGGAVLARGAPPPLQVRAEPARPRSRPAEHARARGRGRAPPAHGWNSIFVTCWLGSGEHSASAE